MGSPRPGPALMAADTHRRPCRLEDEIRGRSAKERRPVRQSAASLCSKLSNPGCAPSSSLPAKRPSSPGRFATRCRAGKDRACSSTTAAIDINCRRTDNPSARADPEECPIRRLRRRCRTLGRDRCAHRDLQADRRRAVHYLADVSPASSMAFTIAASTSCCLGAIPTSQAEWRTTCCDAGSRTTAGACTAAGTCGRSCTTADRKSVV